MSYCVNCGVELANTENVCPLCGIECVNPLEPFSEPDQYSFPKIPVKGYREHHRDLIVPIALIMLVPVIIAMICDLLITGNITWSALVGMCVLLTGIFLFPPMALGRRFITVYLMIDLAAICVFLNFIENTTDSGQWFVPFALPLSVISGALIISVVSLLRRLDLRKLIKAAIIMFLIALEAIVTEFFVNLYFGYNQTLTWSLTFFVFFVILGGVALIINHNLKLKERVKRRFFY